MSAYDRLTALDTSFLHMERLETPMHVGAVSVFEGGPFFDADGNFKLSEARDLVQSRLPLLPRFRKRLMNTPLEQGRPIWVDDDRFDIAYHVRLTALPKPGTWEQLVTLTNRVQETLLDRDRPLWELWFVEGLEGGHIGLIQKTHHALVDGVSGVDVATILLDLTPDYVPGEISEWQPHPAPASATLLRDSLVERITEPAEIARSLRGVVRGPRRAIKRAGQIATSFSTMASRDALAPKTSLNATPVGRHRRLAVVRVPLADVKEIRKGIGGTINDVVLAAVGGGFGRFLSDRGDAVDDVRLRVMCPVSVRTDDEQGALGNRVSAMFVSLPIGPMTPEARLAAVQATTKDLKEKQQAVAADFLTGLTQYAAPTLMNMAARAAHRQPLFNFICTNVPGPQFPLYLMGARMLEAFPIVPLTRNTSVVVGILSYDGTLHFGLFADRDAVPDIDHLAACIDEAFVDLDKTARQAMIETEGVLP